MVIEGQTTTMCCDDDGVWMRSAAPSQEVLESASLVLQVEVKDHRPQVVVDTPRARIPTAARSAPANTEL